MTTNDKVVLQVRQQLAEKEKKMESLYILSLLESGNFGQVREELVREALLEEAHNFFVEHVYAHAGKEEIWLEDIREKKLPSGKTEFSAVANRNGYRTVVRVVV